MDVAGEKLTRRKIDPLPRVFRVWAGEGSARKPQSVLELADIHPNVYLADGGGRHGGLQVGLDLVHVIGHVNDEPAPRLKAKRLGSGGPGGKGLPVLPLTASTSGIRPICMW
jgi:hypothetical protein